MTESIKLDIQEINKNLIEAKQQLPMFLKYRYTFPADYDKPAQIKLAKEIVRIIKERYMCSSTFTAGIEHYTKGMITAKPHLHVHFISKTPTNTIRKGLATEFNFIGRCQGCIPEVMVNEDKFFRYPFKQQKNETRVWIDSSFDLDTIKTMIEIAYAAWIQSAEIAVGKLEAKILRTSEDRLFQVLDNLFLTEPKTYNEVVTEACIYFAHHEQSFNYTTIIGYVDKYLIKYSKISTKKFLEMKGTIDFQLV